MNLPRSYKTKRHNKKRTDTRSAKSCGMGVSICFFLYIKICHGVIRQYHRAFLPQKSPAKTAKVLLTMLANVVYYT